MLQLTSHCLNVANSEIFSLKIWGLWWHIFHTKNHMYPAVQALFLSLWCKNSPTWKREPFAKENSCQREHDSTPMFCFFDEIFTLRWQKEIQVRFVQRVFCGIIFAKVAIFWAKTSEVGFMEVATTKRDSEYFLFSGLTFSQICAHCSSEWSITSSTWQNWGEK